MHLETKPKVKGKFKYKLDDSEQWQKCAHLQFVDKCFI